MLFEVITTQTTSRLCHMVTILALCVLSTTALVSCSTMSPDEEAAASTAKRYVSALGNRNFVAVCNLLTQKAHDDRAGANSTSLIKTCPDFEAALFTIAAYSKRKFVFDGSSDSITVDPRVQGKKATVWINNDKATVDLVKVDGKWRVSGDAGMFPVK